MRTTKFRGKRIDNGEWVYGDLIHETRGVVIQYEETIIPVGVGAPEREIVKRKHKVTVMSETVGQFTGLYDSKRTEEYPKGQPLYEGDIINSENYPFQHRGHQLHYGVIEWSDEHSAFILRKRLVDPNQSKGSDGIANFLSFYEMSEFTKVGNIYENPELIGGDGE